MCERENEEQYVQNQSHQLSEHDEQRQCRYMHHLIDDFVNTTFHCLILVEITFCTSPLY